jgi:hypothetical protein
MREDLARIEKKKKIGELLVVIAFLTFLLSMGLVFLSVTPKSVTERERLVRQCITDGHKEYECRSMRFQ